MLAQVAQVEPVHRQSVLRLASQCFEKAMAGGVAQLTYLKATRRS
jgi:hypothetical protein